MKYTSEVFQRLSRGQFISGNSVDAETRTIYSDIEDNQKEYEDYFRQIDLADKLVFARLTLTIHIGGIVHICRQIGISPKAAGAWGNRFGGLGQQELDGLHNVTQ